MSDSDVTRDTRVPPRGGGRARRRAWCAAAFCAALLAAGTGFAQSETAGGAPIVPVYDEPHHRQLFQHGPVRIIDLQLPPGETSWFHTHEWPILYVTLGITDVRMQPLDGEWTGAEPRGDAGGVATPYEQPPEPVSATTTTSYIEEPLTHRVENVGNRLFRAVAVINATQGDAATSPQAAGFDAEPELENPWFRSYRVELGPGERSATHRHDAPVVVVQVRDGQGAATGPMRFDLNEPGQWAFFEAGVEHSIRNGGDGPLEVLEIEVRRD